MRQIAEQFQRSTSTIYLGYHRVMQFLINPEIHDSVVCLATATTPIADQIASNAASFHTSRLY